MSIEKTKKIGQIQWRDLTVEHAEAVKNFYCKVIGWESSPHRMGDYHDFEMKTPTGDVVAGICHAKGGNANLPLQWLMYVNVEDVTESAKVCVENGGQILDGPRLMGQTLFCVIQDLAGAVLAIHE
ncbi:VOC family protein [Bacillus sp. 2205SS5-2]|uniref:VOC family protein n=1 Tax=Bacillus sp. 2205SS5-2 TaxID=3109031 RepID=UPI003005EC52